MIPLNIPLAIVQSELYFKFYLIIVTVMFCVCECNCMLTSVPKRCNSMFCVYIDYMVPVLSWSEIIGGGGGGGRPPGPPSVCH